MAPQKVTRNAKRSTLVDLNQLGANALLAATFDFLRQNNIPKKSIVDFVKAYSVSRQRGRTLRVYRELERAQEDVGLIMATWFSDPRFLDADGSPAPLAIGKGTKTIAQLIRASGAKIKPSVAVELMRRSPSTRFNGDRTVSAVRRVFVLPKLEVLRAAFVVERFLDTLKDIASGRLRETRFLLERSCHVSKVDFTNIIPMLRDIESRGTAFLDSLDGDLESRRLRRSKGKSIGELGVHVFLWTRPASYKFKSKVKLLRADIQKKRQPRR